MSEQDRSPHDLQRQGTFTDPRCYICSVLSDLSVCDVCQKSVCRDHTIPHTGEHETCALMCEVCDETLLKEEIRAEMQAEIKALNQKLQDVQVDYAHLLQRNATADEELAQLQKDYEESLKESSEAQVNLQKQLSALERELVEAKSEIASLQVSEKSFFNEELRLRREQEDVEKQVDLQQGEKELMEQRRRAMTESLSTLNNQLKDSVPLSQLERGACIDCKARIQALLRDRSPATTSAHSEESPD